MFTDFFTAYQFLQEHPLNYLDRRKSEDYYLHKNFFKDLLDIEVVKVNPNHIENGYCVKDYDENDTKTEVWLKYGPIALLYKEWIKHKDIPRDIIEKIEQYACRSDDKSSYILPEFYDSIGKYHIDENIITIASHDIDLDCGGDTFEEAIIKLANLVYDKYPEYRDYENDKE